MTDTDLITAGTSTESGELQNAVTPGAISATESGLAGLVLPELRSLAKEIGVDGASGMRKSELIAAIRERRGESGVSAQSAESAGRKPSADSDETGSRTALAQAETESPPVQQRRERRSAARAPGGPSGGEQGDGQKTRDDGPSQVNEPGQGDGAKGASDKSDTGDNKQDGDKRDGGNRADPADQQSGQGRGGSSGNSGNSDDDGEGRQGRRGRRFRDRKRRERGGGDGGGDRDTELREDDVVQPVAGILDVLDNYAFVRTSGYLAGPNDVYVSMNMVRKNGLRRGDAVTGAVRVPREGEGGGQNSRQKFNPLVRLDTVNGKPVEEAKKRPEFTKLTPLYPNQRLRLETTSDKLTTRVIDLIMPIGKGQRALIVSPPKAGKTTIMQDIANAITRNNPECHLMVVLVDERPEEVTDMQRSVKGEVIASTFDRPPSDHTQAAELAIERAKRLVEQGKDVVVLLDSITRLGRAYNNASPASGRILSGGVDSTALYPPKRFLGAARNIEEGGSLTIIATAMVETGSTGDTVIFEEFKGTGNAELKLDRKISERRVFPAVDVNPSGTRKDELLLSSDEFAVVHKLRRVLSGLDAHQAIDLLMSQLRKTKNNYEFLVQVSKNTPGGNDGD
ncbi:MAG: transcription termination factor Rho [Mycolicibacterium sp.]|uniref:transcription termination factor Rho n=1 Tax=Mycolicibacterium sp. TaxID=2320850 RepID=UPI003D12CC42